MRRSLLSISAVLAMAQTPGVVDFFRSVAEALAENNASAFFDNFDRNMPGYVQLHDQIETLLGTAEVGSAIEIVSDQGDDRKRSLELDWLLEIADKPPKRAIVKCRIERQGKNWKITTLEPIEFFKY